MGWILVVSAVISAAVCLLILGFIAIGVVPLFLTSIPAIIAFIHIAIAQGIVAYAGIRFLVKLVEFLIENFQGDKSAYWISPDILFT